MQHRPIELLWEYQGIRCVLFDAPYGVELILTQQEAVVRSVKLATADVALGLAALWHASVRSGAGPDAA